MSAPSDVLIREVRAEMVKAAAALDQVVAKLAAAYRRLEAHPDFKATEKAEAAVRRP